MSHNDLTRERLLLGEAIKTWRRFRGLTQGQLAESVGIHRQAVSGWERGLHAPTSSNLDDIARVLRTRVELLRAGELPVDPDEVAEPSEPSPRGRVMERSSRYVAPRVPPAAYQLVYDHCRSMVAAGVPEDLVEEARRLMSGETFNTLHAQMADERDERGWINDVEAAWAFIQQTLSAQGYRL